MASSVTLETLISDVRLYADQRGSGVATAGFLTDAELTRIINQQLRKLYNLLVQAAEQGFYIAEDTISIVAGTSRYDLPDDFFQLKSVTLEWGSQEFELVHPLNSTKKRIRLQNWNDWSQYSSKGFTIRNDQIEFLPAPASAVTCRIQYVPTFTPLVASPGTPNTFDGVNGWEELVTLGAAMRALRIENRTAEANGLQPEYDEQLELIQQMAADRAADDPMQIEDVDPEYTRGAVWWPDGKVLNST